MTASQSQCSFVILTGSQMLAGSQLLTGGQNMYLYVPNNPAEIEGDEEDSEAGASAVSEYEIWDSVIVG